jgi:hypothetical protein
LKAARAACVQARKIMVEESESKTATIEDRAALGGPIGEIDTTLRDIETKDSQLATEISTIQAHIKARRLTSARQVLRAAHFPAADPRVTPITRQLNELEGPVERLIKEGDAWSEAQPKRALQTFDHARELNVEIPKPYNDFERRAMHAPPPPRRAWGGTKIVITVLVLGAVGAGSYYGYQVYKKQSGKQ